MVFMVHFYLSSESIGKSAEKFYFSLKFSEPIMNVLVFNDGFSKHLTLFSILKTTVRKNCLLKIQHYQLR